MIDHPIVIRANLRIHADRRRTQIRVTRQRVIRDRHIRDSTRRTNRRRMITRLIIKLTHERVRDPHPIRRRDTPLRTVNVRRVHNQIRTRIHRTIRSSPRLTRDLHMIQRQIRKLRILTNRVIRRRRTNPRIPDRHITRRNHNIRRNIRTINHSPIHRDVRRARIRPQSCSSRTPSRRGRGWETNHRRRR